VPSPFAERAPHRAPGSQRETVPSPEPGDLNPVHHGARRATRPAARDEVHLVPPAGNAAEQLVKVNLGTASVWVLPVVPVDQQDSHSAPVS